MPAALLSVEAACAADRDHAIGVDALEAWERAHGRLPPRAIVLARTGWGAKYADEAAYVGRAPDELDEKVFAPERADEMTTGAVALAADAQRQRRFFDSAGCDLMCLVCKKGLKGQAGAQAHAQETGHTNFGEFRA